MSPVFGRKIERMKNATIVIPAYNEEGIMAENAGKLVSFMDKQDAEYEIVICSNGSTDGTVEKGQGLERKFPGKVRFFHLDDRGVGIAFEKMVNEASYDRIISMDMDLSVDLSFIPICMNLLNMNSIVVGSKRLGKQRRSPFRLLASTIFISLTKILLGLGFHDYSIAAKGYRKSDIILKLSDIDHGSSYVIDLLYFAKKTGLKVKEVPVYCHDTRKSKFNIYQESIYRLNNLLKLWFRERFS
jgi:glycosyltransferase involved in cell wall biosynthesis